MPFKKNYSYIWIQTELSLKVDCFLEYVCSTSKASWNQGDDRILEGTGKDSKDAFWLKASLYCSLKSDKIVLIDRSQHLWLGSSFSPERKIILWSIIEQEKWDLDWRKETSFQDLGWCIFLYTEIDKMGKGRTGGQGEGDEGGEFRDGEGWGRERKTIA